MTARDKLLAFLDGPQADQILREHAHELSDQIREWAASEEIKVIMGTAVVPYRQVEKIVRGVAELMAALIDMPTCPMDCNCDCHEPGKDACDHCIRAADERK